MSEDILKLSVSKTKTYIDCKKKYNFVYVQKLPRKEYHYHTFGKFVHKVLEDFHMAYIKGSAEPFNKEMTLAFKNALTEYKDKITPEVKLEIKEMLAKYLDIMNEGKKNNVLPEVLACEKEFKVIIKEKTLLNGFIDRVQLDTDGILHVCDYKTTKNKKYLKNDTFQLLTYAYVLLSEDPTLEKVRGSYILLRHDYEYVTFEFNRDEILKVEDKYLEYTDKITEETEYKPNPTVLCNYCEYLPLCDEAKAKYQKVVSNGEINW